MPRAVLSESEINERFKNNFPDFEYIGGYKNIRSRLEIKHKCGCIFFRTAHFLSHNDGICCPRCNPKAKGTKTQRKYSYTKTPKVIRSQEEINILHKKNKTAIECNPINWYALIISIVRNKTVGEANVMMGIRENTGRPVGK